MEEELYYFADKKRVGGLGPFGPALKKHHTHLFKSGAMWKPIKNRKLDVICSNVGGFLTWPQSGVIGVVRMHCEKKLF